MAEMYAVSGETLTGIADAIRSKTGSDDFMTVASMAAAIEGISEDTGDTIDITGACEIDVSKYGEQGIAIRVDNNLHNNVMFAFSWSPYLTYDVGNGVACTNVYISNSNEALKTAAHRYYAVYNKETHTIIIPNERISYFIGKWIIKGFNY